MRRASVSLILLLAFLLSVGEVNAQTLNFGVISTDSVNVPTGEVDIFVEAETYAPYFYRGRSEPTSGNRVKLIAMPIGLNGSSSDLTYHWSINGQNLASNSQTAIFIAPIGNTFTARVTITKGGVKWAEKSEMITMSDPVVLFYEDNALRGSGASAIRDTFSLIGQEAGITAEVFFIGPNSLPSIQGTWKVDGEVVPVDNWQKLSFTRPEEPNNRYHIALELINPKNFEEAAKNSFNLELGI